MNAKERKRLIGAIETYLPLEYREPILRALRLLADAEANEGSTPEADAGTYTLDPGEALYVVEGLREVVSADLAKRLEQRCSGLAARVEELEKDAERSSKKIDFLRLELFSETTARKSAENELFAAIQDADRYRWLRVQRHADIAACWYLPVMPQDYPVDTPEQRDIAIDAARMTK